MFYAVKVLLSESYKCNIVGPTDIGFVQSASSRRNMDVSPIRGSWTPSLGGQVLCVVDCVCC